MVTSRERLFAVLQGHPVDRPPVWLLFPYHQLGCYVNVREHPVWRRVHEASLGRAVVLNRRNLHAPFFTEAVRTFREETDESEGRVIRDWVEYRGQRRCSERILGANGQRVRKLLRCEDDLEWYCSLPVETSRSRIQAALESQLPRYLAECKEFPLDCGAMMLDLGEPIGPLYAASDLEEYAIWSMTHGDLIRDWLERVMENRRHVYDFCLERGLAETYFLVGSELAAPPLVGLETFRSWIMDFARELIERIHTHKAFAIQHFHGQIHSLLPYFLEMGADALHTIEAPPVGNCTLTQAFEAVGDRMALIGNIQYDEFRSSTPAEMRQKVERVLAEANGRRFILSPTAGPFDPEPDQRLIDNYLAFLDAGCPAEASLAAR